MQECDVSFVLFTPTTERNKLAQSSYPMWYEDMIIVGGFSKDTVQLSNLTSSFSVFGAGVWLLLFGSLIVFATILSLAPGSRFTFLFRLKENSFRLLASMFLEAAAIKPRESSSRIVVAFWCIAMLVVTNLYTAKMKAALTVRQETGHRIDSPAQLAERRDLNVYMVGGTAYPKLLSISPRHYDRQVYRMLKPSSLLTYQQLYSEAVLDEVAAGKAVLLNDRTTATYKLAALCQRYPNSEFYI
ncbi:hypothetical protein MTO96_040962, partial [Rhipicephalus appendiculatus]